MKTTLPFRAILRVRLLTMSLNRRQFRKLLFRKLRLGKLPLRKMGRKSPVTMFLRSRALQKLNIGRLPTDMLKTVMHRVDMHRMDMHRMCKRKMRNSHLTHISREPICSTAQCTVTTAMFPTAPQGGGVPPVSDIPQKEMKKSSKAWLIIAIICLVALLAIVMLLLAAGHKNDDKEIAGTPSGSGVTVNINVAPHPADDSLYADKETGLFIAAYNEASGIIISEDGYIITNAHAVEDIKRFKAKLHDEREFEAAVVGIDTRTDLAVLKIEADDLVPAVIGSSDDMKQGEQVIAIGNAGGFNDTVTVGYVSYVNREIQSYTNYPITCIQTDAALNFGNSGGALVNLYGQVVGIVVSKYSSTGSENIGFAIASDFAVPIAEDLIEKGYVSDRPRIGIMYSLITPEYAAQLDVKPGMLISEISPDCDVANTDLQKDDIITELNGKQILTAQDVKNFQNTAKAGDKVTAKVYRKTITGEVTEFEIEFTLEQDK